MKKTRLYYIKQTLPEVNKNKIAKLCIKRKCGRNCSICNTFAIFMRRTVLDIEIIK